MPDASAQRTGAAPDPNATTVVPTARPPGRSEIGVILAEVVTGGIAAVVLLANIVSFAALMFPGDLGAGFTVAIWSMLIGSAVGGVIIALTTSLPPIASGIDSPTGAVLVLLSVTAHAAASRAGLTTDQSILVILALFTIATALAGVLQYGLGAMRLGASLRFVPYFVVGGFLAATGWFLITGGIRMTTGHQIGLSADMLIWSSADGVRLAATLAVLGVLLSLRHWTASPFALPAALVAMWILFLLILRIAGVSGSSSGWYFAQLGSLKPWVPLQELSAFARLLPQLADVLPEVIAVALVALISLITKAASIEVSRNVTADLDRELKGHGLAALAAAPLGGTMTAMQIGTSKLLEQPVGTARRGSVAAAVLLGLVALFNIDVQAYVPTVVIGGLVLFLGTTFMVEALARPLAQRAWLDVAFSILIAVMCVRYGFLTGIVIGIIAACLMFAFNYARIGVIRRHATRAQFASNVDRAESDARHLRDHGGAVQIYWLSGFIFFGSADRAFERIRADIDASGPGRDGYIVLDFLGVPGADSSAVLSLLKLRNFCEKRGISVVCCALAAHSRAALEARGLFGGKSRHKLFDDLDAGLAYCEDMMLAGAAPRAHGTETFAQWLSRQLGLTDGDAGLLAYLEKSTFEAPQKLYREGEPANSIDLVAGGSLMVHVAGQRGQDLCIRRFATHTVVGEMGFFRRGVRSASISTDGPTTLYSLTRTRFEAMRAERPDLALAFDEFIIRTLADRLEFANRTVDALAR